MPDAVGRDEVERVFRDDYGRAVATLTRLLGDLGLAEEAVQDALVAALEAWPRTGVPPSPTGWIVTTARNRAIDRYRREASRGDRHAQAALLFAQDQEEVGAVEDDRLRLVFTCCHPALAPSAQVALTLRMIAGLTTAEVARAFLVPETTMAQRIVRAKNKIRDAHIPYRVPEAHELPSRLRPVLSVVYLVYNEGYVASSGDRLDRVDLCLEAVRLARLLVALMPDEPEAQGLLALLLLSESRRPARVADDGSLVRLADQDRSLWDPVLMSEGRSLVEALLRRGTPGPYQVQAAIAAVHSDAARVEDTDWAAIVGLYDVLLRLGPSDVVRLNRAVALAEVEGPAAGLAAVDALESLEGYHLWHATRADLLERLGRRPEAADAFSRAADLTANAAERTYLASRRDALTGRV